MIVFISYLPTSIRIIEGSCWWNVDWMSFLYFGFFNKINFHEYRSIIDTRCVHPSWGIGKNWLRVHKTANIAAETRATENNPYCLAKVVPICKPSPPSYVTIRGINWVSPMWILTNCWNSALWFNLYGKER